MIKAAGRTGDGTPLLLIGLSAENIKLLRDDKPIEFDTEPLGLPAMKVVVVAGETESDIAAMLTNQGLAR